ncbi:MAG TPA: MFS transporter [Candidatus Sulfotelmatobacter sp.]|nr:MFS transporter [Candidatus Sulfotelmatobacter sp.]
MSTASLTRRWDLRGVSLMAFAHGASDLYSGVLPFVLFYDVARAGLPAWCQGALAFAWYLTSSVAQPLVGAYSDRRGRWWFLPASVALTAVAVSAAAATASMAVLVACVVLGGLGSAVMHPEAGRYSALLGGTRRASAISIYQIGGQVGYGIGPIVAAVLLAHAGGGAAVAMAVPGVLAALGVAALMPAFARDADAVAPRHTARFSFGQVDHVAIGFLVASTALRYLTAAAFAFYLPNLLSARGLPLTASGAIVTAFLIAAALGLYAGGAGADRFGARRVAVLGLLLSVPPLLAGLALHGAPAVVALLIGSALLAVQNAPGVTLAQELLPRHLGTALGLMNGVAFGIGSLGVALIGVVVTRAGADAALTLAALAPLPAALAYLVLRPRSPQEEPRRDA